MPPEIYFWDLLFSCPWHIPIYFPLQGKSSATERHKPSQLGSLLTSNAIQQPTPLGNTLLISFPFA